MTIHHFLSLFQFDFNQTRNQCFGFIFFTLYEANKRKKTTTTRCTRVVRSLLIIKFQIMYAFCFSFRLLLENLNCGRCVVVQTFWTLSIIHFVSGCVVGFSFFFSRCFNVWRSFFRNSSTYTECEFEPLQQTNRKSFEPSNRLPLYRVEVLFQWMTSLPNFESAYWKIRSHRHFFTSHQFAIFFVLRFSVRNHEWLLELICRTATERHDLRTLFNQYQSILIPWRCVVLFGNDKFDYYLLCTMRRENNFDSLNMIALAERLK